MAKRVSFTITDEQYERLQQQAPEEVLDGRISVSRYVKEWVIETIVGTPEGDAEIQACREKFQSDPLLQATVSSLTHRDDLLPEIEPKRNDWMN